MIIDIFIVIMAVSAIFRGRDTGFVRQVFSTIGFFGGLLLGSFLGRYTVAFANDGAGEATIALVTVITTALLCLVAAEHIGSRLKHKVLANKLNNVDRLFGSILGVASILLTVWFMAGVAASLPLQQLQTMISESRIIALLNRGLPATPKLINHIGQLVDPNGFPQVFVGDEPNPKTVALPNLGDLQQAVVSAQPSVVKVEGLGCGGIVEGSGFVVAQNYVATNAHVIAGIKKPVVKDANGKHNAVPVLFDPNMDFAILHVSGLAGQPLSLNTGRATAGTAAVVLGYPGGGAFNAGPAAVLDSFSASGKNIYGKKSTTRDVYEVRADVIPGNSGGPLVSKDGSVIGVIFAQSTSYDHVGYALTTAEIQPEVTKGIASPSRVYTGTCTES
jgi:S1-C subfamily serine protease